MSAGAGGSAMMQEITDGCAGERKSVLVRRVWDGGLLWGMYVINLKVVIMIGKRVCYCVPGCVNPLH